MAIREFWQALFIGICRIMAVSLVALRFILILPVGSYRCVPGKAFIFLPLNVAQSLGITGFLAWGFQATISNIDYILVMVALNPSAMNPWYECVSKGFTGGKVKKRTKG